MHEAPEEASRLAAAAGSDTAHATCHAALIRVDPKVTHSITGAALCLLARAQSEALHAPSSEIASLSTAVVPCHTSAGDHVWPGHPPEPDAM